MKYQLVVLGRRWQVTKQRHKFHPWKSEFHCLSVSSAEFKPEVEPFVRAKAVSILLIKKNLLFLHLQKSPEQIVKGNHIAKCALCERSKVVMSLILIVLKRESNTQKRHCTVETHGLNRLCELTLNF